MKADNLSVNNNLTRFHHDETEIPTSITDSNESDDDSKNLDSKSVEPTGSKGSYDREKDNNRFRIINDSE